MYIGKQICKAHKMQPRTFIPKHGSFKDNKIRLLNPYYVIVYIYKQLWGSSGRDRMYIHTCAVSAYYR